MLLTFKKRDKFTDLHFIYQYNQPKEFQFCLTGEPSTCSDWPDSLNYHCAKDGAYNSISLGSNISLSDTARCESLCRRKREDGCCHLGFDVSRSSVGCFWVNGASATAAVNGTQGLAVTCVRGKIMITTFISITTII